MKHYDVSEEESAIKQHGGVWQKVIQFLAVSAVSGMVGFGTSEMLAVDKLKETVHAHGMRLDSMKETIIEVRSEMVNADLMINTRIGRVADMMEQLVKQNTELITLIRVQNQIGGKH